jgi:hypothetical protein
MSVEAAATPESTAIPLTIIQPSPEVQITAGSELTVSGLAPPGPEGAIALSIQIGYRDVLNGQAEIDAAGRWRAKFTLPRNITGPAAVTAGPIASKESATVDIEVVADETVEGPFITVTRPTSGEKVVAGHIVFFEGRVRDLINDAITFSVLTDDCMNVVARFTLTLSDGAWWGQLILPKGAATGPACAVATTGNASSGDTDWREVRIPIVMLDPEDDDARTLVLGNPGELTFATGQTMELFGAAVNAPDDQVHLTLTQDAVGPGALLAEDTASVDVFGYWEIDLPLPAGFNGLALLTVSTGADETYEELRAIVEVTP